MAHRYWNADSDLDWQYGNAPPEDAPVEDEEEPMEDEPIDVLQASRKITSEMIRDIDAAIPETVPGYITLRAKCHAVALDYGNARSDLAHRVSNQIWTRK